jgi:hypothetical protein
MVREARMPEVMRDSGALLAAPPRIRERDYSPKPPKPRVRATATAPTKEPKHSIFVAKRLDDGDDLLD